MGVRMPIIFRGKGGVRIIGWSELLLILKSLRYITRKIYDYFTRATLHAVFGEGMRRNLRKVIVILRPLTVESH